MSIAIRRSPDWYIWRTTNEGDPKGGVVFASTKALMAKAFQAASKPYTQITKSLRSNLPNVRSRTDIVSPRLCNDAISRLAPSLRKHEGCTIIEINPGIGLWSSKVHDIVRPSKHILAEPPSSPFVPHLEALTKPQDSRYHLVDWPQLDAWEPDRYVAEGLLPALDPQPSKEPNRSILFLANTTAPTYHQHQSSISRIHLKLLLWASDIANGASFHIGGPVRMLLWCPEKDVTSILPRTIRYRSKLSLLLEMTCQIEEVVGSDESVSAKQKKRDQVIELDSGHRVAKQMQELGIIVPAGRETELHKQVKETIAQMESNGVGRKPGQTAIRARGWHEELKELKERFKDVELPRTKEGRRKKILSNVSSEILHDPKFARFLELERNLKHVQKRTGLIEELLQEQARIDALDLEAHAPNIPERQRTTALSEIEQKKTALHERLDNLKGHSTRDEYEFFRHDRKAYATHPPLLMWDHRSAEPMKAYKEEFYPEKPLCLLDIQPRHPLPYPLTGAELLFFRMLTTTIWQNGGDNLTVLDRIAPGAFNAVTPKVPSLTDPTRGGERDIHDLPIRRLTPEMAYGLTKAWLDWPFRPNLGDLIHRGSLINDAASDGGSIPPRGYPRVSDG
ncbi:MAG: hypothetical protein Q9213_007445 [Squamulea squamosa]